MATLNSRLAPCRISRSRLPLQASAQALNKPDQSTFTKLKVLEYPREWMEYVLRKVTMKKLKEFDIILPTLESVIKLQLEDLERSCTKAEI